MQTDENRHANHPSSGSDHEGFSSKFQLSTKLADTLQKLAPWRLSHSSIEFPRLGGPEFCGGYATVSRAFLTISRRSGKKTSESYDKEHEAVVSDGPNFRSEHAVEHQEQEASKWQKVVAVKKMKIEGALERVLGLTLREARFLVELEHENIVALEGFVEDVSKDIIWLVFPWEDHGTLKAFIALRNWEIPERISLIDDVARGVEYLHSCEPPVCHGDLKSVNVLVNSDCRAIITDFGSARRLVAEGSKKVRERIPSKFQDVLELEAEFCASTNTITLTGSQYTLRWAAPELLQEDQPGLQSDIWALGWVAYEVMTNSIPFQDVKDTVVIKRVIQGDLPSITADVRILMIRALCSLMVKCWSIDPAKRPTAEDCQKSITWMASNPMIIPNSPRPTDAAASGARSPRLLLELGTLYEHQDDYSNASECFSRALELYTEIGDQDGRAQALWSLAQIQRLGNKLCRATSLFREALHIYADMGNKRGRAEALEGLAMVHHGRYEYCEAISLYFEVLQICAEIDNKYGRASALMNLAQLHRDRSEYNQAFKFYLEAIETLTDLGEKQARASAMSGLACVHRVRSEWSEAIVLSSQALEDQTDIGDRRGRAATLWGLADVHRVRSEWNEAVMLFSQALEDQTCIGDRRGRAITLLGLADVHRARNEYSQAAAFISEALNIVTDLGDKGGRGLALGCLADLHRLRKEYDEAATLYSEALEILINAGDRLGTASILWGIADVHRLRGEYDEAVALYAKALGTQTDIGYKRGRAASLRGLADLHRLRNDYDQAVKLYQEALEIQTDIGDRRARACTLGGLADLHRLRNQYIQAIALYSEVLKISTDIGDKSRNADVLSGLADVYRDQGDHGNAMQNYEQAAEIYKQIGHATDRANVLERAADVQRCLDQKEVP